MSTRFGGRWLAVTAALASCATSTQSSHTPRYLGGATPELAVEVLPIIRRQTREPITEVEKKPDGTLYVRTGTVSGSPCFVLKKSKGKWRVISDCIWVFGRDTYTASNQPRGCVKTPSAKNLTHENDL